MPLPALAAGAMLILIAGLVYVAAPCQQPQADPTPPQNDQTSQPATKPNENPAQKPTDPAVDARAVEACYLTRRNGVPFMAQKTFKPVELDVRSLPGLEEVAEGLRKRGRKLPYSVWLQEQENEMRVNNLGVEVRLVQSLRAFVSPDDGHILAFDLAVSNGGTPQRLIGHLTKDGVSVDTYTGGKLTEASKEISFTSQTHILPLGMEFVHSVMSLQKRKVMEGRFFLPQTMNFAFVVAKADVTEMIAVRGVNHQCMRYDVAVSSNQALEGSVAKQQMWFDLQSGRMVRRVGQDTGLADNEQEITEQVEPRELESLQTLVIRPPPATPTRPFPYPLDKTLTYRMNGSDGKFLGRIAVKFSKEPAGASWPAGYIAESHTDLDTRSSKRRETAFTRFDENFVPIQYRLRGEETVETRAYFDYTGTFKDGGLKLTLNRHVDGARTVDTPPVPAPKETVLDYMRLISIEDEAPTDERVRKSRTQSELYERVLSQGTYVIDFHRVEHLAGLLLHLPACPTPKDPKAPIATLYTKLPLYHVRQNQAGVLLFSEYPEVLPPPPEDEKPDEAVPLVPCTVVNVGSPMLPCKVLVDPNGRLMQWTSYYGTGEVIYTLEDPQMKLREDRERIRKGQEGPTLLRPPWE